MSNYAGHNEDLRNEAEEQKKLLERVGYFLPIPLNGLSIIKAFLKG